MRICLSILMHTYKTYNDFMQAFPRGGHRIFVSPVHRLCEGLALEHSQKLLVAASLMVFEMEAERDNVISKAVAAL